MKHLRNWDNKTWLASNRYLLYFHKFIKTKIKINKNTKILDIGCGRGNIINYLFEKYRFKDIPIGVDIVKSNNLKKNIIFKKIDAIEYLKKNDKFFDLILIKQTIHFFPKKKINTLLNLCKKRLNKKGMILIFSLKTKNNQIPSFKLMKKKLIQSLVRDKEIFILIKKNFEKIKIFKFKYKVIIRKTDYIKMIKKRFISCLINLPQKEISKGVKEIKSNFKTLLKFEDILECFLYKK